VNLHAKLWEEDGEDLLTPRNFSAGAHAMGCILSVLWRLCRLTPVPVGLSVSFCSCSSNSNAPIQVHCIPRYQRTAAVYACAQFYKKLDLKEVKLIKRNLI